MVKTNFSPRAKVNKNGLLLLPKLIRNITGIKPGDIIIFNCCEVKKANNGNQLILLELEKEK